MRNKKNYTTEFKAQMVKEVLDTGNIENVSRIHQIPRTTLHGWVHHKESKDSKSSAQSVLQLKKKLADSELEILVLKELLKKTNQAWLKD